MELPPFDLLHMRDKSRESNSDAGKMDQAWSIIN